MASEPPDTSDDDAFDEPDIALSSQSAKVQRWVDLLAALLIRRKPATFDDLADDVPAYGNRRRDESLMRMFERDKDELRRFGIAIETVTSSDAERTGYRLATREFYLPFVALQQGCKRPSLPSGYGYQTLDTIVFEPDELEVVSEAGARAAALGDPMLRTEVESAMRKLWLDLPEARLSDAGEGADGVHILAARSLDVRTFDRLCDALTRRKAVTFEYHGMERDDHSSRSVEPYGLFFVSAHWYLAGRDRDRAALRNFRLSRMEKLSVNGDKPQTPDFVVPDEFRLSEHARAREPWELGDGDAARAIVEFRASSGAVSAAMRLGTAVEGAANRRAYSVRRVDSFARWVLSFGGDALPVAPETLVAAYARIARETLACYEQEES